MEEDSEYMYSSSSLSESVLPNIGEMKDAFSSFKMNDPHRHGKWAYPFKWPNESVYQMYGTFDDEKCEMA